MAQLSDDCFAFGGPLLLVEDVERLMFERVSPVREVERASLDHAAGRVLAEEIIAPLDLPPFDNSAVDGYAVCHADLEPARETRLVVADRLTAGSASTRPARKGEAIRIFTGAPMPARADTVFMQEDCRTEGACVIVPAGLAPGANRRLAGEDVRAGAAALPAGRRLGPQHAGAAARARCAVLHWRRDRGAGIAPAGRGTVRRQPPLAR